MFQKRKRDESDQESMEKRKNVRYIKSLNLSDCKDSQCAIFPSGDFLVFDKNESTLHHEILNSNGSLLTKFTTNHDLSHDFHFESCRLDHKTVDLVFCSTKGKLILFKLGPSNENSMSEHNILLSEDDEEITALCHFGFKFVIFAILI
jgi:hypothetical protein